MGIYDALQLCRADVSTIAFGLAASTAAIVLAGGSKGKRFAMPNARIMMHQPMGGASGQAIDVEIQAKEVMYHKNNITRILSEITGRPFEQVIALVHNLLDNYFAVECTTAICQCLSCCLS
jgi:ATP-dependent Clp protease protease subunit